MRTEELHDKVKNVYPGTVYLAGPICGISPHESSAWRKEAQRGLAAHGIYAISPLGKESWSGSAIVASDLGTIRGCACVLAHVPTSGSASIGTSQELFYAFRVCKPRKIVVVWGQERDDNPVVQSPFLNQHCDIMFVNLGDAIDWIVRNVDKLRDDSPVWSGGLREVPFDAQEDSTSCS